MANINYPKTTINIRDASQRDIPFQPDVSGLHKPFFPIMAEKGPVNEIINGNASYLRYIFGDSIFDVNSKTFNHSNIFLMEALENNEAYVVRVASENIKTSNILISARYRAVFDQIQNNNLNGNDTVLDNFNYPIKGRIIEIEWRANTFEGPLANLADGYFEDRNTVVPETSSSPLSVYNVSAADRISNTSPGDELKGFSKWMPILGLEADSPGPNGNDFGFSIYPTNEAEDTITRDNLEKIAFRFIARQKDTQGRYDVRININNDNSALVSLSDLALDKTTNTDYSINDRIESLYQTVVDGRSVSNFEASFKPMPMNIRRLQNIVKTSGFAESANENWYHQLDAAAGDKLYYTAVVDENSSKLYHEYEDTNVLNEPVYDDVYLGGDDKNTVAPYFNNLKTSLSHMFTDYVGESVYQMVNEDGKKLYKRSEEDNHIFYDTIPYGLDENNEIEYAKAFVDVEGDPSKIIEYSDKEIFDIDAITNSIVTYLRTTDGITNGATIFGTAGSETSTHLANIAIINAEVTTVFTDGFDHTKLITNFSPALSAILDNGFGGTDPIYVGTLDDTTLVSDKIVPKIKEDRVKSFLSLFREDGKLKEYNADGTVKTNKIPDHLQTVLVGELLKSGGTSNFTYLETYPDATKELDYSNHFAHKSIIVMQKSIVDNDAYTGTNFFASKNIPTSDDLDNERYSNNPADWVYYYVPKSLLGYKNPYDIFQYDSDVNFSNDFRNKIVKNIKVKSQKYTLNTTEVGKDFNEPDPKYVTLNNVNLYESKTIANSVSKHVIQDSDYNETNSEFANAADENSNRGINNIDGTGRKKLRLVTCTLSTGEVRVVKHRDNNGRIVTNSDGQYGVEQYNTDGSLVLDSSGNPSLVYGKGKVYIQLKQITSNLTVSPYSNNTQTNKISLNYPVLSLYKNVDFYNFDGKNHITPRRLLNRSVRWNGWRTVSGEAVLSEVISKSTLDGDIFTDANEVLTRSITRERNYLRITYNTNNEPVFTSQERTRKTTATETTIERTLQNGRKETINLSPVEVSETDVDYDPFNFVTNPDGKHYHATSRSKAIIAKDHVKELKDTKTDKVDVFNALTPRGRSRLTYTRTKFINEDNNYTPTSLFSNNKNITLKGGRINTELSLAEEKEKENYFPEFEEYVKDYLINDLNILQKQRFPITHIYDSGFTDATKQACIGMLSRRDDVKVELVTQIAHHFEYDGSTPVKYLGPNRPNTMSQDIQISASLSDRVRLNPESKLYNTNACRASIWGQSGKSSSSLIIPWKAPVPVGLARMKFRAIFDGSFSISGEPVGVPYSRIYGFDSISWTPPALPVIESELTKSSLNIVDFYDDKGMHYRDYRTVYTEGNSVLLDDIVLDRIIYTIKIARRVYFRNMVGARGRSSDIYQSVSSIFSNQIVRAFDTALEASMQFRQTAVQQAQGDSHTLDLSLKFPIPVRIVNISIHSDRIEG